MLGNFSEATGTLEKVTSQGPGSILVETQPMCYSLDLVTATCKHPRSFHLTPRLLADLGKGRESPVGKQSI
jgi:hypothetical protein